MFVSEKCLVLEVSILHHCKPCLSWFCTCCYVIINNWPGSYSFYWFTNSGLGNSYIPLQKVVFTLIPKQHHCRRDISNILMHCRANGLGNGGGSSTVDWLSSSRLLLYSVEHSEVWHSKLLQIFFSPKFSSTYEVFFRCEDVAPKNLMGWNIVY